MADLDQLAAKVATFRALHAGPAMLVMANAWDAASAQRFEAAGFPAIATTSGGVAISLGYADHEQAPVDEMLAAAARMVRAVPLPVTVDFEAGYGLAPDEIARRSGRAAFCCPESQGPSCISRRTWRAHASPSGTGR